MSYKNTLGCTGKSVSEALILESVNPQYDERLFIEFQEKYKLTTCCVQKMFFCFDIQNNICTQHVVNLYFSWNSTNNLSSYCGLTDARMRASEKDLPVTHFKNTGLKLLFSDLLTHNKLYLVGDSPFL
jgi:hypothetical protein